MVEKWSQTLPFVSTFFARCGQVVGVPENATRLLERDEALLVFPEGTRDFQDLPTSLQLTDFGSGLHAPGSETNTPDLPLAVVGAEEQYISVGNLAVARQGVAFAAFPLIPQLLIPGGQFPLPTRYRLLFRRAAAVSG